MFWTDKQQTPHRNVNFIRVALHVWLLLEFFEKHKNGNNANIGGRGFTTWKQKTRWTRMHSSRMRTACSLTVSRRILRTPPPEKTTHAPPEKPCMPPPKKTCMPPRKKTCKPPGATMHTPRATTHDPQSNHACPPEQPCTSPRNHAAPQSNHGCTPQSNYARPPGVTMHAPIPQNNLARPPPEQPGMLPPLTESQTGVKT